MAIGQGEGDLNVAVSTHRGYRVDRVQDGEQKHTVDAPGVIRVTWARDLLAGRVIDKSRVTSNVDLVVRSVVYCITSPQHVFELYQCLPLLWHYHHIAAERRQATVLLGKGTSQLCEPIPAFLNSNPQPSKPQSPSRPHSHVRRDC